MSLRVFVASADLIPAAQNKTSFFSFENLESNSLCSPDGDEEIPESCRLKMKLIKAQGQSTPNSPSWPLMFKNVYSLGGSNIDLNELELDIVYVGGNLEEQTHSQINDNKSFLYRRQESIYYYYLGISKTLF